MLIAVQGQLIDTRHIYTITEPTHTKEDYYSNSSYFWIISFNDKKISVSANVGGVTIVYGDGEREREQKAKIIAMRKSLEQLRNEIIAVWRGNQGTIPSFDLQAEFSVEEEDEDDESDF